MKINPITFTSIYSDLFDRKPDFLVNKTQYQSNNKKTLDFQAKDRINAQLMEVMVHQCAVQNGTYSFGLDIGKLIHPSDYGIIGYALMNCTNLEHAFQLAAKYKHFLNEGFCSTISDSRDFLSYRVNTLDDISFLAPLIELDFASALQLSRFLVGPHQRQKIRFTQVSFTHQALGPLEKYASVFECPVYFEQDHNQIEISRNLVTLPVHAANANILAMLERKIARLESNLSVGSTFSQEIYSYLTPLINDGLPSASEVANNFCMSVSSMKKRLQKEGMTYQAICDAVKAKEAKKLVSTQSMSLKAIAHKLGFARPASFTRAFKRWTEMTPMEYRRSRA